MNIITGGVTFNESGYPERDATLYNINSIQEQTSPIPYETKEDGDWESTSTWLNGDVWDIQDPTTVKPWAIFRINNNVNLSSTSKSYGLILEDGNTISVSGDQEVK